MGKITRNAKTYGLLLGLFFIFINNTINAETIIKGAIENIGTIQFSPKKQMKFMLYAPHLSNEVTYKKIDLEDSTFQVSLDISEPQIITLTYLRRQVYLYVEPFDTLQMSLDADNFPASLSFEGKAGINNKIFAAYSKKFPEEKNQFKMMQYRKGTLYYKVGVDLDGDMRKKRPEDFKAQMDKEKIERAKAYEAYKAEFGQPSELFELYLWADINYTWAYNLLTYGHSHGFRHGVTPEFFFFVHDVPLMNNKAMGNPKYRNYVKAYMNYVRMEKFPDEDEYFKQVDIAKAEGLRDEPYAFFLSNLLVRGLRKHQNRDTVLVYYQDYLNINAYEKYNQIVMDTYQEVNRYAAGQYAPNFTLKDTTGNLVSLDEYRGKTIYLDFWASWCRPCVTKLQLLQTLKDSLATNEDIVFIHISFDNKNEEWLKKIRNNNFTGLHLDAPESTKSDVAEQYNIKALPEYFIITPQGTFAQKPRRYDIVKIQEQLEKISGATASSHRN
jgi:thiol-disulfide isomerase/thioredoxin